MEPLQYKISEHSLGQIVLPPSPAVLAQALTNMEKYHYFIISTGEDLCMRALRDSGLVGLELFKGLLPNWDKLALESVNSRILFWKEVGERVLASSPYLSVFQRLVACYEEFFPPTCRAAAYFLANLIVIFWLKNCQQLWAQRCQNRSLSGFLTPQLHEWRLNCSPILFGSLRFLILLM